MNALAEAAVRLLEGSRLVPLMDAPLLLVAAAAKVFAREDSDAALSLAASCADPGLAFLLTAAVGDSGGAGKDASDQLQRLGLRVPAVSREAILIEAEPLLINQTPAYTWRLVESLLGPVQAARSLVGLYIARTEEVAAVRTARAPMFLRLLAADDCARAAARGVFEISDSRLAVLLRDPTGQCLFDAEAEALMVAAAFMDAGLGLNLADALSERGKVGAPALTEVARRVVAAGCGGEVAARASIFVEWMQAAALAGVLTGEAVEATSLTLAEQVICDTEPGSDSFGALPLIAALGVAERLDALTILARSAGVSALVIVQQLFDLRCTSALQMLLKHDAFASWAHKLSPGRDAAVGSSPRLWSESAAPDARAALVADALIVASGAPWTVTPGSLADRWLLPS